MSADALARRSDSGSSAWPLDVLLAGTAVSDRRAFAEIYRQLSPGVMRTVRPSFAAPDATDQVVVGVFVQIWRTAGAFDPRGGTAESWVMAIIREQTRQQVHRRHVEHH